MKSNAARIVWKPAKAANSNSAAALAETLPITNFVVEVAPVTGKKIKTIRERKKSIYARVMLKVWFIDAVVGNSFPASDRV